MTNMTACFSLAAITILSVSLNALAGEPSIATVEKQFRELPMEARRLTGPLFWMHGTETRAQLEGELQKVLEGGNGIFTAEPRPHKDWLGEGWYRDLGICLEFAKSNNLQMIIYDDWWWPSQMMGGRVPPQYGSKRLEATSVTIEGPKPFTESNYGDSNLVAIVAGRIAEGDKIDAKSLVNLTTSLKHGTLKWEAPPGKWRLMKFTWRFNGTKGNQKNQVSVDGASPDCVAWFIKTVYQPHYDRFKADFGKTIVGYFYDEPETQGDWGSDVPVLIAERKLDLATLLVGYKFKLAGEDQTAAFQTYLNLFAESWSRTMYGGLSKWCKAHNVFSMGHFMEHGSCLFNRNMSGGNMMQLQKYSDMGGIDLVCRQLYPGQRNMGSYQMPKIASSLSHTYNKANDIAFCEIFGGYNQNLTYPQMKWLADWHQVRGVNLLIPHSFNPRAPFDKDYPPYFYNGGFEPRWPLYRIWADYSSRLSLMLTGGKHVCPIALLHVGQSVHSGKTVRPEELTSTIQDALYDCDWLNYDAFENDATLSGKEIKLHKENYQVLIVPPVEVIPYPTLAKAKAFLDKGGIVIGHAFLPTQSATLGKTSADIAALNKAIWGEGAKPGTNACNQNAKGGKSYLLPEKVSVAELSQVLAKDAGIPPGLDVLEGDTGNWLHILHREKSGSDLFLICNQNHEGAARKFRFRTTAKGTPEIWDPMRNELNSVQSKRDGKSTEFALTLEPMESVILVFNRKDRQLPLRLAETTGAPPAIIEIQADPHAPKVEEPEQKEGIRSPVKNNPFYGLCDLPASVNLALSRVCIEVDELAPEGAANITVNGAYAGGFIGKPYRLDVTKHLKTGRNTLKIAPFAPNSAKLAIYPLNPGK